MFTILRDEHSTQQVHQLRRPHHLDKQPDKLDDLVNETQRLLLEQIQAVDPLTKAKREARSTAMALQEIQSETGRVNVTIQTKSPYGCPI